MNDSEKRGGDDRDVLSHPERFDFGVARGKRVEGYVAEQFGVSAHSRKGWTCLACGTHFNHLRRFAKHLDLGQCKSIVNGKRLGYRRRFLKYCTCKGTLLWPIPWHTQSRDTGESGQTFDMESLSERIKP